MVSRFFSCRYNISMARAAWPAYRESLPDGNMFKRTSTCNR
ncbi:hypothetical protein HMPREF9141_1293 [Prevotella multiformis DSM 16608]|uniref:Uncharacterized protein n=1 Tax=Prevotella multiformis DSM 16608 TaxID=888743 RepID=F0F6S6_9BACT|nr:hypothetical protein HMPREF9141_1293 [Prevotella multiformis DSM 16608]